jgi:hypothetical protein
VRPVAGIIALVSLLCSAPAFADGVGPGPNRPNAAQGSPAGFLHDNQACRTASDGCRICTRTADGIACSTAGFACLPAAWTCTEGGAGKPR